MRAPRRRATLRHAATARGGPSPHSPDLPVAPYSYPHTIENGAGERLTFLRRVQGPTGDRVEGESVVAPGAGPPMHVHHLQEEALTVQQGRMGYQRLGEPA